MINDLLVAFIGGFIGVSGYPLIMFINNWRKRPVVVLLPGYSKKTFFFKARNSVMLEARAKVRKGAALECSAHVTSIKRNDGATFDEDGFGVRWSRSSLREIKLYPGIVRPIAIIKSARVTDPVTGLERYRLSFRTWDNESSPVRASNLLGPNYHYEVTLEVTSKNARHGKTIVKFATDENCQLIEIPEGKEANRAN